MVAFKNRYMVMEVFVDPNRDFTVPDPIILTQFNITRAMKDSIKLNFGECGLATSSGSLLVKYVNPITKVCIIRASREDHQQVWCAITMIRSIGNCPVTFNLLHLTGSCKACRDVALKYDEAKFEQYKLLNGGTVSSETILQVRNCFEKIKSMDG